MFFKSGEGNSEGTTKNRIWLIVLVAVAGIALLIIGGSDLFAGKETQAATPVSPTPQEELEQYRTYLEKRIKTLCESVNGVGTVTVAVTLTGNFEEVYATELINGNEEYVIVGSGSNASALHLSRVAPEIAGIGIVCTGGDNTDIHRELLSLICAAFHVPSNRVYIATAKNMNNSM